MPHKLPAEKIAKANEFIQTSDRLSDSLNRDLSSIRDIEEKTVGLRKELSNIGESLLDDYANPNTEMPSYTE